jgi:hypothetical protein
MRRLTILAVVALVAPASAQRAYAPPDFSGLWRRTFEISETFEPPPSGPGPVVQDPRYPSVNHDGVPRRPLTEEERKQVIQFTQNWVPDVNSPILQPKTRATLQKIAEQELAGYPHPELQTMCMPPGTPSILNLFDGMKMLQTPTEVLFLYVRDHHVRHVYLNQPHSRDPGHSWWGDSVGHYEGDTLVVDTIGENAKTQIDRFGTPHSDQIHVVERYRRSADGRTIEVLISVEDPLAFTTAWSARARYAPGGDNNFDEVVCAENQRQFWPGHEITFPVDDTPDF